jgi:phage baseplate assembly protein W
MSFWVPSNFRQLPQTWEMAQPFRIGGSTVAVQGQVGMPALNWAPGTASPPGFYDPGASYNVNDAVMYNNMVWTTSQAVTGVPPLSPMLDDNGDPITDINGNPIYPWANVVNWNASTQYNVNDAVLYMNQSWMATVASSGVPPGSSPLDDNGNPMLDTNGNPIIPWSVLPLKLGTGGGVAYDTDPVLWAQNHILALLLTSPGERVMRPGYGAGLRSFVFESNDPFVEQTIISATQQSLQAWEPNITINEISMTPDLFNAGLANVTVHFSVGVSPTRHTIAFSMGGIGVEVMS